MKILFLVVSLLLTGLQVKAGLGWNYAECQKHYGKPRNLGLDQYGLHKQAFDLPRYTIIALFGNDGKAVSIQYLTLDHGALNESMIQNILAQNAETFEPGVDVYWTKGEQAADGTLRFDAWEGIHARPPWAMTAVFSERVNVAAHYSGNVYIPTDYFWTLEIDSRDYIRFIEEHEKEAAKNL
jgi:hypothetical protein